MSGIASRPMNTTVSKSAGAPPSPLAPLQSLLRHRPLIAQLTSRAVHERYRGSVLGFLWALVTPIVLLLVYWFVFGNVFEGGWRRGASGGGAPAKPDFALFLFVGLVLFWLASDVIARAPNLIRSNPAFVKRVVFPLEVLLFSAVGSAIVHAAISTLVLLLAHGWMVGMPPWTVVLFPLVVFPLVLFCLGLGWFLASLGTYFPDVSQFVNAVLPALLFFSTIFYPAEAAPQALQSLLYLNPLSLIVDEAREVLLLGHLPDWQALGLFTLAAWVVAWLGLWWFERTRPGFADVL